MLVRIQPPPPPRSIPPDVARSAFLVEAERFKGEWRNGRRNVAPVWSSLRASSSRSHSNLGNSRTHSIKRQRTTSSRCGINFRPPLHAQQISSGCGAEVAQVAERDDLQANLLA